MWSRVMDVFRDAIVQRVGCWLLNNATVTASNVLMAVGWRCAVAVRGEGDSNTRGPPVWVVRGSARPGNGPRALRRPLPGRLAASSCTGLVREECQLRGEPRVRLGPRQAHLTHTVLRASSPAAGWHAGKSRWHTSPDVATPALRRGHTPPAHARSPGRRTGSARGARPTRPHARPAPTTRPGSPPKAQPDQADGDTTRARTQQILPPATPRAQSNRHYLRTAEPPDEDNRHRRHLGCNHAQPNRLRERPCATRRNPAMVGARRDP
jgi:hypothetical protein